MEIASLPKQDLVLSLEHGARNHQTQTPAPDESRESLRLQQTQLHLQLTTQIKERARNEQSLKSTASGRVWPIYSL